MGRRLQAAGHDVRPLDQAPELEALADEQVLALATAESRILVTHNVHDFPASLRQWGQAGQSHAGVILVYGISPNEFDLLRRGIEAWLQCRPSQADWRDYPAILDREFANRSKAR